MGRLKQAFEKVLERAIKAVDLGEIRCSQQRTPP